MEKNFELDIQEEVVEDAPSVQLPVNFLSFGEIENDDVKVYIKQDVYKALEKLAASDTGKELGSIILGEYCQELGKTHVIISQYIEAKYTDASASTLTFTHETWDYVHSEHEEKCPDKKIVGWQHTHPNYGIFLSNYDLFIQENFFNLPFQVAYVIDPVQNLRGFFQWKNGCIEKLKGYYIYDDIGVPIKVEQTKGKKEEAAVPAKVSKVASACIALFCVAALSLSLFAISLNRKYEKWLAEQEMTLQKQEEQIGELRMQLAQTPQEGSDEAFVTFKAYTVVPGDTLYGICAANNLNYGENYNIILAINGIQNADQLYAGQTILLPVVK